MAASSREATSETGILMRRGIVKIIALAWSMIDCFGSSPFIAGHFRQLPLFYNPFQKDLPELPWCGVGIQFVKSVEVRQDEPIP